MKAVLEVERLSKSLGGQKILDSLNLKMFENEICAIIGKSGSGKTTLLLCLLGFQKIDDGSIKLNGNDVTKMEIYERQLAYVPQDYGLFPHLTVKQNIVFGLEVRNENLEEKEETATRLMKAVELPLNLIDRNAMKLSGGQKQRVALARALAIKPNLFLLDEPLSAIDFETRMEVAKQLRSTIKKLGIPAIIITNDPRDAQIVADTIYLLKNGRLEKLKK